MTDQRQTKEKLLETAMELIWLSNYSNVGVNEICKKAGVTKGGFYHYFESKADLFCEASRYHWENMKVELGAIVSPSLSSVESLQGLFDLIIQKQSNKSIIESNPVKGCPIFTSGAQAGMGEEKIRGIAQEMSEKSMKYYSVLVERLKSDKNLNSDCDADQVARLLQQYVQGLLLYGRIYQNLEFVKRDIKEGIYRILDLKMELRK